VTWDLGLCGFKLENTLDVDADARAGLRPCYPSGPEAMLSDASERHLYSTHGAVGRTPAAFIHWFRILRGFRTGVIPRKGDDMTDLKRRDLLALGLTGAAIPAIPGLHAAAAAQTPPAAIAVEKDVVFGKGGDLDLKLDIYRPPAGSAKRMATIHFHGGGFAGGSKDTLADRIRPFASLGYVAIAAQYRLSGQAGYPALIHDAKAAIRWTRANARTLGIDPQRIAVVGYSAGGYHALFTAGTSHHPEFEGTGGNAGVGSHVAACVAFYPATNIPASMLPRDADDAATRAANATTYIAAAFPPTIVFHGTKDTTIPIESSERLVQQLRGAGAPVEFHEFEGVPHVFDSNPEFATLAAQLADFFIDRHVLNPRTYPPFTGGGGGRGARTGGARP
jgi:acetyl esterase/lipase